MTKKKFILKAGNHQFVPGSHAAHNNENLDDDEAAWYLKTYPHIANLFEQIPTKEELTELKMQSDIDSLNESESVQSQPKSVKSTQLKNENLLTPN